MSAWSSFQGLKLLLVAVVRSAKATGGRAPRDRVKLGGGEFLCQTATEDSLVLVEIFDGLLHGSFFFLLSITGNPVKIMVVAYFMPR